MNEGRLDALGTPDQIYNRPRTRFIAAFAGNPPMNVLEAQLEDGRLNVVEAKLSIAAGERVKAALESERRAVVGVRPEDVYLARGNGNAEPIEGEVLAVEPMGREDVVLVETGGAQLRALVPSQERVRMDDRIAIQIDSERLQLFDSDSGESLLWR